MNMREGQVVDSIARIRDVTRWIVIIFRVSAVQ